MGRHDHLALESAAVPFTFLHQIEDVSNKYLLKLGMKVRFGRYLAGHEGRVVTMSDKSTYRFSRGDTYKHAVRWRVEKLSEGTSVPNP